MGAVPASALDPIFYAHHTNIDRLYECWLNVNEAARLPTNSAHLNTEYTFVDADGSTRRRRVSDMLRTSQLGYGYSAGGDCPPRLMSVLMAANTEVKGPVHLGRGVNTIPLSVPAPVRAELASPLAAPTSRKASVVIEGLRFDEPPGSLYNVYLQAPDGRREQIGVINFFGSVSRRAVDHAAHSAEGRRYEFDATSVLQRLVAGSGDQLSLVIEPTTGLTDSSPATAAEQISPQANVRFDRALIVND